MNRWVLWTKRVYLQISIVLISFFANFGLFFVPSLHVIILTLIKPWRKWHLFQPFLRLLLPRILWRHLNLDRIINLLRSFQVFLYFLLLLQFLLTLYMLLIFIKNMLIWCLFNIWIYCKRILQYFEMAFFETYILRVLGVHSAQCLNYPLVFSDDFWILLLHFFEVSTHYSFNTSPLVCYLVRRFDKTTGWEIYSSLYLKPFTFSKVEDGNE